jgi:hypothetical protein
LILARPRSASKSRTFLPGPATVEIELGARYIFAMFMEIKGKGSKYRGQWQGGRVAATKRERQV